MQGQGASNKSSRPQHSNVDASRLTKGNASGSSKHARSVQSQDNKTKQLANRVYELVRQHGNQMGPEIKFEKNKLIQMKGILAALEKGQNVFKHASQQTDPSDQMWAKQQAEEASEEIYNLVKTRFGVEGPVDPAESENASIVNVYSSCLQLVNEDQFDKLKKTISFWSNAIEAARSIYHIHQSVETDAEEIDRSLTEIKQRASTNRSHNSSLDSKDIKKVQIDFEALEKRWKTLQKDVKKKTEKPEKQLRSAYEGITKNSQQP